MTIGIGMAIVIGSILLGYGMHGGHFAVLMQVSELIIIGGAAFGAIVIGNTPKVVVRMFKELAGLLRPGGDRRNAYNELLHVLYEMFYTARRDGLVSIESHVEDPETSELFRRYPSFHGNHHAREFLADTMKVLLAGTVEEHHLSEILDTDLEVHHDTAMTVPRVLHKTGDALPAFGIVAAVLGVIITMGHIGGSPEEIGEKIAAALVGTLLGVFLAYAVVNPLAQAIETRVNGDHAYLRVLRTALLSFARGDSPASSVEFARRSIGAADRPSFSEVEDLIRGGPRSD